MEKYKRIITEVEAIVFEEGMEDSYLVYETEYPESGHYGVPKANFDPSCHTKLANSLYNRGEYQGVNVGDYIVHSESEKNVWKKSKFERTFVLSHIQKGTTPNENN